MREAHLADGTVLQFPDNTADDVIDRVVKQHVGGAAPSPRSDYKPWFPTLSGMTTEAGSGATFGLSDYTTALAGPVANAVRAPFTGEPFDPVQAYKDRFNLIRSGREKFQQEHPVAATAGQLAGTAALAPTVTGKAVDIARSALPFFPKAVQTGAGLAGAGAIEGGIYGGLEARPGENVAGATQGAALGAVMGTAFPGVLALAGWAGRKTLGPMARGLWERIMRNQPVRAAERKLLERIDADQMTPRMLEARLRKLGPEAILADAGGENVRGLAEDLANQPGRARNMANRVLEARQLGQSARLAQTAQEGLGASGDFYGRMDALSQQRRVAAKPLYEEAFAMTPFRRENLTRFTNDPIIKQGINRGLEIQRLEALADNTPFNPSDYAVKGFDKEGNAILDDVPNIRLMDAAKRGLDEIINDARDAVTGKIKWTERLRAIDGVRKSLVRELDTLTGGVDGPYAKARAVWAGPSQSMDAMQMGRRFMRGDPEVTARMVQNLPEGQRDFFREGVFQELQHKLGSTSETRNQTLKFLRTPNVREALRAVFPDERAYREFMLQAMRENRFSETKNVVRANSATARREAGRQDLGVDPSVAVDTLRGAWGQAAVGLVRKAMNSLRGMPTAQRDHLANMLFSQNPQVQQQALQVLGDRVQRGQLSQATWEALRNLISGEAASQQGFLQGP